MHRARRQRRQLFMRSMGLQAVVRPPSPSPQGVACSSVLPKPKPKPKRKRVKKASPPQPVRLNPWTLQPAAAAAPAPAAVPAPAAAPATTAATEARIPVAAPRSRKQRAAAAEIHSHANVAYQAALQARARACRQGGQRMMLAGIPLASYASNGEGTIMAPLPDTPQAALAAGFPWDQAFMPRRWNQLLFSNQENNMCDVVVRLLREVRRQLVLPPPPPKSRAAAPHMLVLMGPPGCGKTTLLRLLGEKLDVRVRWLNAALLEVPASVEDSRGRCHKLSLEAEVRRRMEDMCRTTATKQRPRRDLIVLDGVATLSVAERAAFLAGVIKATQRKRWAPILVTVTTPVPSHFWRTFKTGTYTKFILPCVPRTVVSAALTNIATTIGERPRDLLFWLDTVEGGAYGDLRQAMMRAQMGVIERKLGRATWPPRAPREEDLALGRVEKQFDMFQAGALLFSPIGGQPMPPALRRGVYAQRLAAAESLDGMLLLMMFVNIPSAGMNMSMHDLSRTLEDVSHLDQLPWMRTVAKEVKCAWAVRAACWARTRAPVWSQKARYRVTSPVKMLRLATEQKKDIRAQLSRLVDVTQALMVALLQRRWRDAQGHLVTLGKDTQRNVHVLPVQRSLLWKSLEEELKLEAKRQQGTAAAAAAAAAVPGPKKRRRRNKREMEAAKLDEEACTEAITTVHKHTTRAGGSMKTTSLRVPPHLVALEAAPPHGAMHARDGISRMELQEALHSGIQRVRMQRNGWVLYERGFFGPSRFGNT